jgi:hypothetical protein
MLERRGESDKNVIKIPSNPPELNRTAQLRKRSRAQACLASVFTGLESLVLEPAEDVVIDL